MELLEFNFNDGSNLSPDSVGSAFLVELTGLAVSSESSSGSEAASSSATVQATGDDSSLVQSVVGFAMDLFCFQNSPYECEGYFGQASVLLSDTMRCSVCEGDAFSGIGTPGGSPTPAPVAFDDDDGLSKVGQERGQGSTPGPTPVGFMGAGSDAVAGSQGGSEAELLGVTGTMRWVVVGLIGALGAAVLVCLCLLAVSRSSKGGGVKTREEEEEGMRPLAVGPRASPKEAALVERGGAAVAASPTGELPLYAGSPNSIVTRNPLFSISPGGTTVVRGSGSVGVGSRAESLAGSRRGSRTASSMGTLTPLSVRKSREVARQRVLQMSSEADSRAEAAYWKSPGSSWDESGPGLVLTDSNKIKRSPASTRRSFTALTGTDEAETMADETVTRRGRAVDRGAAAAQGSRVPRVGRSRSRRARGGDNSDGSTGRSVSRGRGRGRSRANSDMSIAQSEALGGINRNGSDLSIEIGGIKGAVLSSPGNSELLTRRDAIMDTPDRSLEPVGYRSRGYRSLTPDRGPRGGGAPPRLTPRRASSQTEQGTDSASMLAPESDHTVRAMRTLAGGARLPINARRQNRGGDSPDSGSEITVSSIRTAPDLPEWVPDTTTLSAEDTSVYSRGATDGSPVRRVSPVGSSYGRASRRAGATARLEEDWGWATELYRTSSFKRKGSAKVHNGKLHAGRSDWSAEGNVDWNRHTPGGGKDR